MDLKKYINMPNVELTQEIKGKLSQPGGITKTNFEDKNDVLLHKNLHTECGYDVMKDGFYLVSMYTAMPNVTKEMIDWWFWWHAQDAERYKAWYPGEHLSISYDKKDKEYFQSKTVPVFKAVTHYPTERVGPLVAPLSIKFVSPTDFGFSQEIMDENNVATIVCGHVGAFKDLIPNTEMSHIYFKTDDGLYSVSRFWLGKRVKNKLLRKIFVTEKQAKGMAEHCFIEYGNFVKKIPQMYSEWLSENI
ncbi:MAG: hypothetical protein R3Y36_02830 [Spirochaetales bacterium]